MGGSLGHLVPRRLCCHRETWESLGTLVSVLPTASLARMCAWLGILLPKQIQFLKNLNELLFREVKGLGCGHGALSVAVQD